MMTADPLRRLSSTAMAAAAVFLTVAVWAECGGGAVTLEVSNQRILPENYLYIWCSDGVKREKGQKIPPKKVLQIQVASGGAWKGGQQLPYICTGTYTKFYGMDAAPYCIYSSRTAAGDVRVMANETSFYRWNGEKRAWDVIRPSLP
ncbi:unnamed protein product [Linum trigynum]|uniref:Uncharacterized protein n=2 Tax=Linum trigynum TaxID=586398 RepID=A0AAV2G674_9ROSI